MMWMYDELLLKAILLNVSSTISEAVLPLYHKCRQKYYGWMLVLPREDKSSRML